MPYGLPAATSTLHVTRCRLMRLTDEQTLVPVQYLSIPANRTLTLHYQAADQDGWEEPTIITNDPVRGGNYRLAVPKAALHLA